MVSRRKRSRFVRKSFTNIKAPGQQPAASNVIVSREIPMRMVVSGIASMFVIRKNFGKLWK